MHRRRRPAFSLLLLLLLTPYTGASEHHGRVLASPSGLPVVGATVTGSQGGKNISVVTDELGAYSFPDLTDGVWSLSVEMTGFAPVKQQVTVAPDAAADAIVLKHLTLEELLAKTHPVKEEPLPVPAVAAVASATPGAKPQQKTAAPGAQSDQSQGAAPESAAVEDPNQQRSSEGFLINGSVNNAATSQYALNQAFGNTRKGRSFYNGGFSLVLDNSAFDAKPYSLTGVATPKPAYNNILAGFNLGGPLEIPHFLPRAKAPFFFLGYQRTLRSTDSTISALVPTLAQREGLFPTQTIYDPAAPGTLFPGMVGPISPQAQALLNFYPLPNAANSLYNYQAVLADTAHADAFTLSVRKQLGRKDSFNGGIREQSLRSGNENLFGFKDRSSVLGLNADVSWHHNLTPRLWITTGYTFSRSRTQTVPFFQGKQDVSGQSGITGNSTARQDWGPPTLSFSSGIYPLSDATSAYNRSETNAVSWSLQWNRSSHNVTAGADLHRQEFNNLQQQNPRGTFTFNGTATANSASATNTSGSDFADFLLGVPDTSQIAFGNPDKYLRDTTYDVYLNDDWRVTSELTVNAGLRWEYGAPMTELFGRLVNLDIAPGFTAVAPVLGSSPEGSLTEVQYPTSLIRPDRSGWAPRIGVAWRPLAGSSLLVRAGYGISNDTSVYEGTALAMSQQAPLSKSVSVQNSSTCPLTLANGFRNCSGTTPNTFAVDPGFRVGYAQTWQLQIQRDLPASMQMVATYLGIKGTRGVQEVLPNTYPIGAASLCASCPVGYLYRTSNGNSTREAGSLQLRRRLRNGLTATALYTFSKSLDDDYAYGGRGGAAAGEASQAETLSGQVSQDWLHPEAQRGLSTFDQRHLLSAQLQYTTGQGIGGRTLMSGWKGALYKEWTGVANLTVGSGLPQTPVYPGTVPGTGYTGVMRANVIAGVPVYVHGAGIFVNPSAFAAPAPGAWGTARRDSIEGPDRFGLNFSLARTFRLHDRYNLDARLDSTNILNHVTYSGWNTTVGSPQFGAAAGTNAMRSMSITMRLRF